MPARLFDTARDLHIRYLICLYHVYSTLEIALQALSDNPALCSTYNPALLGRATKLEEDIRFFLDLAPGAEWKDHKMAIVAEWPSEIQQSLAGYVGRIQSLAGGAVAQDRVSQAGSSTAPYIYAPAAPQPELLLAHSYVRYMGDLSGGQSIRKSIAAAYSLPLDHPDGQRFYEFGSKGSEVQEIKAIKRAFRKGLDVAGQTMNQQLFGTFLLFSVLLPYSTKALADDVLQEANHTFELNIKLFSSFAACLPPSLLLKSYHAHSKKSGSSGGSCPFVKLRFAGNGLSSGSTFLQSSQSLQMLVALLFFLVAALAGAYLH